MEKLQAVIITPVSQGHSTNSMDLLSITIEHITTNLVAEKNLLPPCLHGSRAWCILAVLSAQGLTRLEIKCRLAVSSAGDSTGESSSSLRLFTSLQL